MGGSDRFVTLRHVADPVEAEMLRDLLEQEGIGATVPGNHHSALLGTLGAAALQVPLQVREKDLERAREILDALHEYDEADPIESVPTAPDPSEMKSGDGPYRAAALAEGVPPRRKIVAAFAALVLPMVIGAFGAGHFYVRSYGRGFALLALGWTCAILGIAGTSAAWIGVPIVMALDLAGALGRVDAYARESE